MIPLFPSFFFLLFSNPAFLPSLPPDTCLGEKDSASDLEESSLVTVPPPPPPGQIDSDANNPILGPESEPIIAILNITGVRLDEVRFSHHWAVSFFFNYIFFSFIRDIVFESIRYGSHLLLILFLLPFPPQQATDDECIQALSTAADELTSALIPSENEQEVRW